MLPAHLKFPPYGALEIRLLLSLFTTTQLSWLRQRRNSDDGLTSTKTSKANEGPTIFGLSGFGRSMRSIDL